MPMQWTIDTKRNRVCVTGSGEVTRQQIVDTYNQYLVDPLFRPDMDVLVDLCDATLAATTKDLRAVVGDFETQRSTRGAGYRIAIVVDAPATYGQSRQYAAFSSRSPVFIKVFRDLAAANEWLDALQR